MEIFRDNKGSYYLQFVPEIDGKRYLYSLDSNTLILVDDMSLYVNIRSLDFATTKATTQQLLDELLLRKDNPFDFKDEDIVETTFLVGYFTEGKIFESFDVHAYKNTYVGAMKLAAEYKRKPTIIKVMNIIVQSGDDL